MTKSIIIFALAVGFVSGTLAGIMYSDARPVYIGQEVNNVKYALNEVTNHSINGVYFGVPTYCVAVGDRTIKEINKTHYHEACHALIDKDYNHFCK